MSSEAKVGTVVIVALAIFVATFLQVASIRLAGEKITYRTYFAFAGGIDSGDLVRYGGRKAGTIIEVRPAPEDPTRNEVIFEVRDDVPVNADSIATVGSLSALGDNYLEITPGTNEARRLEPGETLPSREAVSFSDITNKMIEVTETAQVVMVDLRDAINQITDDAHVLIGNLQEITGEKNRQSIEEMLANANTLVSEQSPKIDRITTQVTEMLERVDRMVVDLRKVADNADKMVLNANRTVEETREPLKKDLAELEATLVKAREMLEDVRVLVIVNEDNINETVENFRVASENIEQLTNDLRQQPWSLVRVTPKPDRAVPVPAK